ncbi:hypothetical protein HHK36_021968 [Tetracentron sinense]|uniref:MLO-like protein n=1 Tax=Tetracentron sinense TaxID=13715 RepID=A0A834YMC1_TETSI|nr:hypothetical protein HHK36_021968 [Tetracentron sinense]
MAADGEGEGAGENSTTLEYSPTWVVALVCSVIYLKKKNQKPLFEALQKIKEELMLLGFISLLLTVSQNRIAKFCIPKHLVLHLLPCKKEEEEPSHHEESTAHFSSFISGSGRHLLAESSDSGYCAAKGKVPLLSREALHHLHIFIFVLAVVHVIFCVLTVLFGGAKIRQWKRWEDSIAKDKYDTKGVLKTKFTHVHQHAFIKEHFLGMGKNSPLLCWLHSFVKQFFASVTKSDYITLRLGFIMTHCRGNLNFNFHKYMMRVLEADFKKVVGIR